MNKIVKIGVFALFEFASIFSAVALKPINTGDALKDSAAMANRRTALRCLALANDYAVQSNWGAVASQVELGLAYDDSISDLWYMKALACNKNRKPSADVLSYAEKALELDNWANYNYDSARVLYADILCDTLRYEEVSAVLDKAPLVFSADAEYIRAKSYYRIRTPGALEQARNKIDNARQIYPKDSRFPLLFFKNESPTDDNEQVRRIANFFISTISQYAAAAPDKDAELEIYAALFARGAIQTKMLQSFSARGLKHPLFAEAAVKKNLLSQEKAVQYIEKFAAKGLDYEMLKSFVSMLSENDAKEKAAAFLLAFNGTIFRDTDGDGIYNMRIVYSRGRPKTIIYDANQDELHEWRVACDFGNPLSGSANPNNMFFEWGEYPYLKVVGFRDEKGNTLASYDISQGALKWTPVKIEVDKDLSFGDSIQFYVPVPNLDDYNPKNFVVRSSLKDRTRAQPSSFPLPVAKLASAASLAHVPTKERTGASIIFYVLDGKIQSGDYMQSGQLYARAQFKNDMPYMRSVDADGDGIFETTEIYEKDKDNSMDVHSMEDERNIIINMFGSVTSDNESWYLKQIQVDTNRDSVPDFTEEYLPFGGKISSWDTNNDGKWDIRFVKKSRSSKNAPKDEAVLEEAYFYDENKVQVCISSKGGVPASVTKGGRAVTVTEDPMYKFYWLGKTGSSELAKEVLTSLSRNPTQCVAMVVEHGGVRVKGIKIGDTAYGMIMKGLPVESEKKAAKPKK